MLNPSLKAKTIADLNSQADKLLKVWVPSSHLWDLRVVRELLRLDRHYYSSEDDSAISETVSRIKVAGAANPEETHRFSRRRLQSLASKRSIFPIRGEFC